MYRTPARASLAKRLKAGPKSKAKPAAKRPSSIVKFGRQPWPKQLYNTIRYCEIVQITSTSGSVGTYTFSCNGVYDPNISGAGHQPLYFDELMALYNHCTALRSRIKVRVLSPLLNNSSFTGIYIDDDTNLNSLTTWDKGAERIGSKNATWNPYIDPNPTLYHKWDAGLTFGPGTTADSTMQCTSGANPTEQSYYAIWSGNNTLATATVDFYVEIEYDCVWDEIRTPTQS